MEEPEWNQRLLTPPLVCNMKTDINDDNFYKLKCFKEILDKCVTVLEDDSLLSSEIFLFARLIYKRNLQLRREKTMQYLRQIYKCMKRYVDLNLKHHILKFKENFDEIEIKRGKCVYIPCQQMLQHILIKIISVAMLLSQTTNYCVNAFIWCKMGLEHGHLIPQYLLYVSSVSRIWALCSCLYLNCIKWYKRLLPLQTVLQTTQVEWLSKKNILPKNLDVFVKETVKSNLENMSDISPSKTDNMLKMYLMESTSVEDINLVYKLDNKSDEDNKIDISLRQVDDDDDVEKEDEEENREIALEDLGAPVSRELLFKEPKKRKKTEAKKVSVFTTFAELSENSNTIVENCQSFNDLIKLIKSCSEFLPNKHKKCLKSVNMFKAKYLKAKKVGKGGEAKIQLFSKALNIVNIFIETCRNVFLKRSKLESSHENLTNRQNVYEDCNSKSEPTNIINVNCESMNENYDLGIEIKNVERLKEIITVVDKKSVISLNDDTIIQLNKKQKTLLLKKLKLCHQKCVDVSLKSKQQQKMLLKTVRMVERIIQNNEIK